MWEATPPRIDAISPIGAGDALAAACWSLENGDSFHEALRWGVAAGSASAKLPGINFATLEQTREITRTSTCAGSSRESAKPARLDDRSPGLLKSAGIVSAAVMTSRVTGLVRESVLSWLFGAGATYDAYVLGYRIPTSRASCSPRARSPPHSFPRSRAISRRRATRKRGSLSNITATV